jgi:NAD(P)-dependent dehydrogenase (short-subunit alcohol dehydrogenase family)
VSDPLNVLVTGCSSGFGELIAVSFADLGHRVFATMRTPGKSALLNARSDVEQLALDVTDTASVDAAIGEAIRRCGRLDVLVNNAGIEVFGAVHLLSDDEVVRQFDTNVTGVVRTARAVVPHMLANGGGAIVTVGSVAGRVGTPYGGLYAASKHAVEALTESMHFELAHRGIRVSVVEPGQFATNLAANSTVAAAMVEGGDEYERWQRYRAAQRTLASGEPADPQLVADAVVRAATERPGVLRHAIGRDADLVLGAKGSMSFEDFDAAMRAVLGWHE